MFIPYPASRIKRCDTSLYIAIITAFFLIAVSVADAQNNSVTSPSGAIKLQFNLVQGSPAYQITYNGEELIHNSTLGYTFKEWPEMADSFELKNVQRDQYKDSWSPVWGQQSSIRNHYNEMIVTLRETHSPQRTLKLHFKVYDDGIGFRYIVPEHQQTDSVTIMAEHTQFTLANSAKSWWIPANYNSYEKVYRTTPLHEIDSVNTPITLKTERDVYLSLHEADLTNYAGMTLYRPSNRKTTLKSRLVPWPDGAKVKTTLPLKSPWRTIQIANQPGELIKSNLIVNLNRPNKLEDTSWIKPMNYIGIWWHYHIRTHTWWQGEHHGATTERMKEYIDFAAEHNIGGVVAEGWNVGWGRDEPISFVTPYDDYNLPELARYARENNVTLISHNETRGDIPNYESQVDSAFDLYQSLGIHALKTGYAGQMRPEGTYKHGQFMINHYREIVKKAAEHQIMLNVHEPIKPTGIRRTWPNMMTREGVRGMEFNAWSDGNPPEHTTIIPFTRMLGGPLDYTPGIFDVMLENFSEQRRASDELKKRTRVHTTRAKQLALYPILFSPIQMAADLVPNYRGEPEFQFIEQVPSTWHATRVLNAEIGDYLTIARRHNQQWYLGSITDENSRTLEVELNFLESGRPYRAIRYADAENTDWKHNPTAVTIDTLKVRAEESMRVELPASGGQAIHFIPVQ